MYEDFNQSFGEFLYCVVCSLNCCNNNYAAIYTVQVLSLELQWLTLFYYAITGIVDMDFSGQFGHLLVSKMEYVDCIVFNSRVFEYT